MKQPTPASTVRSRAGKALATIAALVGLALPASMATAQQVSPEAAPRAWIDYAQSVNSKVTEWLRAEDEPATRVRSYVDGQRPAANQSSAPLVLQLWVNGKGVVTRVEFPPFANQAVNTDLRGLLVGKAVGGKPPRGMLLPLLLAVQLDPVPEPAPGPMTGADVGRHDLRS